MGHVRLIRRERRWIWALAVIAAVCCLATVVVFSPGYMSPDTFSQFKQAMGWVGLTDWHPPVMALVWRALIAVTGTPASMAVLQCVIFWAALWVIAWCVWDLTASRGASLAILGLGLAPHVLTFVGVLWKDVHMAFALLAVSAVAFIGRRLPAGHPALRGALLGLGVLFLVYAILVRKNAILAAIPVFVMLVLALWRKPGRRMWAVATVVFVVGLAGSSTAISAIARPAQTNQGTQIMLDDLVHVLKADELRAADVSPDLRRRLAGAAEKCDRINSWWDSYFTCWEQGRNGWIADTKEIRPLWAREMTSHLSGYVQYRLRLFSSLLFKGGYQYKDGISANTLGFTVSHPRLKAVLQKYVLGTVRDLPFLFAGWFWLAVGLVLSIRPGTGMFAMPIRALGVSSAAYVLGYLPIMVATDYRYIYWPAIAGTLGLLLYWVGRDRTPPEPERSAVRTSEQAVRPERSSSSESEACGLGDGTR